MIDDDYALLYGNIEKPPFVLDIGHFQTRAGFAGDAFPKVVRPTRFVYRRGRLPSSELTIDLTGRPVSGGAAKETRLCLGQEQWEGVLAVWLREVFVDWLQVNPGERKLLVLSSLWLPLAFRNALASQLFTRFQISALILVPAAVCSLQPLLAAAAPDLPVSPPSALVVDFGHRATTVVPVFDGYSLPRAVLSAPFDGRRLVAQLLSPGADSVPDFVAAHLRAVVAPLLLDALLACPIDVRCQLAKRVVLAGGLPLLGLSSSSSSSSSSSPVAQQLMAAVQSRLADDYQELAALAPLLASAVQPTGAFAPDTLAWTGGSILASVFPQSLAVASLAAYQACDRHWVAHA